jgi:hypothetical protein
MLSVPTLKGHSLGLAMIPHRVPGWPLSTASCFLGFGHLSAPVCSPDLPFLVSNCLRDCRHIAPSALADGAMATIERDFKLATPTSIEIKPVVTVMNTRREGIMIGDGHRMMVSSNTCHDQGKFGVREP